MKNLLLILSLIMSSGFLYSQNDYKVHVELSNANKETILKIDEHISTYNRYINENVISFTTIENYSEWFIDSLFVKIGVEPFLVIKDKLEYINYIKAGGNNCEQAMQLCNNSTVPGNSSGSGIQELNAGNRGCLSVEHQSSWYYLNVLTPGSLIMRINPDNNNDDYDFAVWGPFTAANVGVNCPPVTAPIRCSFSAIDGNTGMNYGAGDNTEGAGGDKWVNPISVSGGEVYIVLIDNFSTSSQGYNIQFSWGGKFINCCFRLYSSNSSS